MSCPLVEFHHQPILRKEAMAIVNTNNAVLTGNNHLTDEKQYAFTNYAKNPQPSSKSTTVNIILVKLKFQS